MAVFSPEERAKQELYNEYVIWRLEMIHSSPETNPSNFSTFDEWQKEKHKKPRLKKRIKRTKT